MTIKISYFSYHWWYYIPKKKVIATAEHWRLTLAHMTIVIALFYYTDRLEAFPSNANSHSAQLIQNRIVQGMPIIVWYHLDRLVQERRNSSTLTMELRPSSANPSICYYRNIKSISIGKPRPVWVNVDLNVLRIYEYIYNIYIYIYKKRILVDYKRNTMLLYRQCKPNTISHIICYFILNTETWKQIAWTELLPNKWMFMSLSSP